ncbi:quinol monooxygenase YgiN [Dysgonomonas hofstadii]|uniref:Quinol monooxygenase YgiN n=1 Tax=Dysgonomonas hofstadii TaxID=637886 RepID=A0A840CW22_9BACT|nr:putative quinol monooxygenase [Dysgonomonas hofstadii]MBB4036013.1 quinol monooxygenase YgiN [Dysgonomonas hofstadii]
MKRIMLSAFIGLLSFTACNQKTNTDTNNIIVERTDIIEERTGDELKIVAISTVKPEAIQKILPLYQALVTGSQEEDGCISYNLHQDINDSTKFVMLEEWKSQEAINFHNNTKHYKAFKEASKGMVEKSEVSILKLVY